MTSTEQRSDLSWVSYAEFGDEFVRRAVTVARVEEAVGKLTGKTFTIGPFSVDPVGMTKASADGTFGAPVVTPVAGERVTFRASFPVAVTIKLKVGTESTYTCDVKVAVTLSARTADPLKIVIDIPEVKADDITMDLRAEGVGSVLLPFVDVIEREIRRQAAKYITAAVNEPNLRAKRVFDIAAAIEDEAAPADPGPYEWISYAEFGRRFFLHAVTENQLMRRLRALIGRELSVGPLKAGPREMAEVVGTGTVGEPRVSLHEDELVRYDAVIPIALDLTIKLARSMNYRGAIDITVSLFARAAEGLLLVVDIPAVVNDDIDVQLDPRDLAGRLLQLVGALEGEIRKQVTPKVNGEIPDPVQGGRVVDVGARVDAAGK